MLQFISRKLLLELATSKTRYNVAKKIYSRDTEHSIQVGETLGSIGASSVFKDFVSEFKDFVS